MADGYSRYEFEVFSGAAVSVNSTALQAPGNILLGLVRAIGLVKKPPVAAIHEFVLKVGEQDGVQRFYSQSHVCPRCRDGPWALRVSSKNKTRRQGLVGSVGVRMAQ